LSEIDDIANTIFGTEEGGIYLFFCYKMRAKGCIAVLNTYKSNAPVILHQRRKYLPPFK
jgi:hypothetical protein